MFRYSQAAFVLIPMLLWGEGNRALAQDTQASLAASRTIGVAPLAVHFDATGTTHSDSGVDPFHDLYYMFDFGDDMGANRYERTITLPRCLTPRPCLEPEA